MFKVVGQAEWMVSTGARLIDPFGPAALFQIFSWVSNGALDFRLGVRLQTEEAKAEALSDPSIPGPLRSYAEWYSECLASMRANKKRLWSIHQRVIFSPPDTGVQRKFLIDIYADHYADRNEPCRVLWIDVFKAHPTTKPQRVLDALS